MFTTYPKTLKAESCSNALYLKSKHIKKISNKAVKIKLNLHLKGTSFYYAKYLLS